MKSFDVTCMSEDEAGAFSDWLDLWGVDNTYDEKVVTVPYAGSVAFMMEIYQAAVDCGFADDRVASDEMCALLP